MADFDGYDDIVHDEHAAKNFVVLLLIVFTILSFVASRLVEADVLGLDTETIETILITTSVILAASGIFIRLVQL